MRLTFGKLFRLPHTRQLEFLVLLFGLSLTALHADEPSPVSLPAPEISGGKPLLEALQQRRTTREIKPDPLPPQVLANLLWAAFGINRPQTGQRTAPSAMDSQEIDVYVATPEGLYLYAPKTNGLKPIVAEDLRARTGGQDFMKQAPVTLIFVADLPRLAKAKPETRPVYAFFDAGCISQNVYLYCASAGLATVVHELDRAPLTAAMKLRPEQQIIMAQAVGYPKERKAEERKQ
jgi:nitroreductase